MYNNNNDSGDYWWIIILTLILSYRDGWGNSGYDDCSYNNNYGGCGC